MTLPSGSLRKSITSFSDMTDDFIEDRPPDRTTCGLSVSPTGQKFRLIRSVIRIIIFQRLPHFIDIVDDDDPVFGRRLDLLPFQVDLLLLQVKLPGFQDFILQSTNHYN